MWNKLYVAVVTFAAFFPIAGQSQVARMEILSFQSMTLTDQAFLTGSKEGKPVAITGELRLTRAAHDRLPVIVLLRGEQMPLLPMPIRALSD